MASKSVLHQLSGVATLPQFDLWSMTPTQVSVEKDMKRRYYPLAPVQSDQPLEFVIQTADNEYLNWSQCYLKLKCQAVLQEPTEKNTAVTSGDWDKITPVQNLMHNLFNKVDVYINNKPITQAPQNYNFKSYLHTLLGFSESAKKSYLESTMWMEDKIESSTTLTGAKRRNAMIRPADATSKKGKIFELFGRLHLDLTFTPKYLLPGCEVKIRLNREDASFFINTSDPTKKPTIEILEASLVIHKSKATQATVKAHNQALNVNPALYPFARHELKYKTILSGSQDAVFDNIDSGQMPRRMFAAFVPSDAFAGKYEKDPFTFSHCNVSYLAAFVDGTQYPDEPLQPDFKEDLYVETYHSLFQGLNQDLTDTYCVTNYEDFKKSPIFCIQFSPDLSDGPGQDGHVSPLEHGTLRLLVKFAQPLTESMNLLLLMEYDSYLEIYNTRQVVSNYN